MNKIDEIIIATEERRGKKRIRFNNETPLEDFGFDSLDVMEIIIQAEGEYGRRIPNRRIKNIYTVGDLYALFEKHE